MNTGFQNLDKSHFSKFNHGTCLVTGESKYFINSVFQNIISDGNKISILGDATWGFLAMARTAIEATKRDKYQYIRTYDPYGQEMLINAYYNKDTIVKAVKKDIFDSSVIMMYIDKQIIANDEYVFSEYCSKTLGSVQPRSIFLITNGKIDPNIQDKENLFKIYADFSFITKYDYDVEISSNFDSKCSGTHSIHIEPEKNMYDKMSLDNVLEELYELCYPSDSNANHDDSYILKMLLNRYGQITGKERPGFMK